MPIVDPFATPGRAIVDPFATPGRAIVDPFAAPIKGETGSQENGGFLNTAATALKARVESFLPAARLYTGAGDQKQATSDILKSQEEADKAFKQTEFSDIGKDFSAGNYGDALSKSLDKFKEVAGASLGSMAPAIAAGQVGTLVAGPLGGIAAFTLTTLGSYIADNVGRQKQEQEKIGKAHEGVNSLSATVAGAGQTALDLVGFKLFKPLGTLVGLEGKGLAQKAAEEIVQAATNPKAYRNAVAKGLAQGIAFEVPQEVTQQVLERWQAGLPLDPFSDPEAAKEYLEAAGGALLLGGPLGATSKAMETRAIRQQAEQNKNAQTIQNLVEPTAKEPQAVSEEVAALAKTIQDTGRHTAEDSQVIAAQMVESASETPKPPAILPSGEVNPELVAAHAKQIEAQSTAEGWGLTPQEVQADALAFATKEAQEAKQESDALAQSETQGEPNAGQTITPPVGAGDAVRSAADQAGAPEGLAGAQRDGVVPNQPDVGQPNAGENGLPATVAPEQIAQPTQQEALAAVEEPKVQKPKRARKVTKAQALAEPLAIEAQPTVAPAEPTQGTTDAQANQTQQAKPPAPTQAAEVAAPTETPEELAQRTKDAAEMQAAMNEARTQDARGNRAGDRKPAAPAVETRPGAVEEQEIAAALQEIIAAPYFTVGIRNDAKRHLSTILESAKNPSSEGHEVGLEMAFHFVVAQANKPKFSRRGDKSDKSLPVSSVQTIIDTIKARWKNAPEVVVASTMDDPIIPQAVRDYNDAQKEKGAVGEPDGFFYGGKVYVIADQMSNISSVIKVLFHEALGHAGLRGVFGVALKPILRRIIAARRNEVEAKAIEYKLDVLKDEDLLTAAEEVLAVLAQTRPEMGFVKQAIAFIRNWLRANVPMFSKLKLTDADIIQDYILPARDFIEQGKAGTSSASNSGIGFSRGAGAAIRTATKAFKRWFGDSKVVDAKGEPLVVYHATDKDITTFKSSKEGALGNGIYVTPDTEYASGYAEQSAFGDKRSTGGNVMPLFVRITNPLVIRYDSRRDPAVQALENLGESTSRASNIVEKSREAIGNITTQISSRAKKAGYDGILYTNEDGSIREAVAFEPNQIKSATGNNGEYSTSNSDIRFSRGETPTPESVKKTQAKQDKNLKKLEISSAAEALKDGTLANLIKLRSNNELVYTLTERFADWKHVAWRELMPMLMTETLASMARKLELHGIMESWEHINDLEAFRTRQNRVMEGIATRIGSLYDKNQSMYTKLTKIIPYSTLVEVDPTKKHTNTALARMWDGLDADAKQLYVDVRDFYRDNYELYYAALKNQVADMGLTPQDKEKVMAGIKQMYEDGKKIQPYFPLMRYGAYWARVGNGKNSADHMFESVADRGEFLAHLAREKNKTRAQMIEDGDVDIGDNLASAAQEETSLVVKRIFDTLNSGTKSIVDDFGNTAGGSVNVAGVKDAVYQMFLQTLPERSFRKKFIHRQGKAGFSTDILRDFKTAGSSMINQVSRVKYSPAIMLELSRAKELLKGHPDKAKLGEIVSEMQLRIDRELNPQVQGGPLDTASRLVTTTAFVFMMSSIKTAIAQFSALPVFVAPVLAPKHGKIATAAAMGKWMNVFNGIGIKDKDGNWSAPTIGNLKSLTEDQKKAVQYMIDRDISVATLTADTVGRRDTSTVVHQSKARKLGRGAVHVLTSLFHHVERMIREVAFMSAYDLNRKKMGHEAALLRAEKEVYESLNNYHKSNRPRGIGQNAEHQVRFDANAPLGRAVLQFKMFPAFVTTYFIRNAWRMTKDMDPKVRKEAREQLIGSMVMSLTIAGTMGVPGISALFSGISFTMGVIQGALASLGWGDDDEETPLEKRDLLFWFRNKWLPQTFGGIKIGEHSLAELLDRGVVTSLTGYDITSSLSMNNMWFPEVKEAATTRAMVQDYFVELAGPGASLVLDQIPGAIDYFNKGEILRGIEQLMPALVRAPMTAARYAREGALTSKGAAIREAKEFTTGQLMAQSLGFATEGLQTKREEIFKLQGQTLKVTREKIATVARLENELTKGSDSDVATAFERVFAYNDKNWFDPISADTINAAIKRHMKQRFDRGFPIDKKYYPQIADLLEPGSAKLDREEKK